MMKTLVLFSFLVAFAACAVEEPTSAPNQRNSVTLETVTDDNIDIILRRQSEEFKKEAKR